MQLKAEQEKQASDNHLNLLSKYEDLLQKNDDKDRQIKDLEEKMYAVKEDKELLQKTVRSLRKTRKTLIKAKGTVQKQKHQVKVLNNRKMKWETAYHARNEECMALKSEMNVLKAHQHMELVRVQASKDSLQKIVQDLQTANHKLKKRLESRENIPKPESSNTSRDEVESIPSARKSPIARADTLQNGVNAPQVEKCASERQFGNAAKASAPRVNEQTERLQNENQQLRKTVGEAETLEAQLRCQIAGLKQGFEERLAKRVQEFETGFNQGFESLRKLREQLLLQQHGWEEQFNREMVAEDHRRAMERQGREQQLNREMVAEDHRRVMEHHGREEKLKIASKTLEEASQRKEEELQGKENELQQKEIDLQHRGNDVQRRENDLQHKSNELQRRGNDLQHKRYELDGRGADLATQERNLHANGQTLIEMKNRAEGAEEKVRQLEEAVLKSRPLERLVKSPNNDVETQRRNGKRHSDLLNEETSKMAIESRLPFLYDELQNANFSIDCFEYFMGQGENSVALSQRLNGADFYESDVHLLQLEGRPVLLAQLQAAKRTLERLRSMLAESTNVNVGRVLSILTAPRGDEDTAPAEILTTDDIFGESVATQQTITETRSRKRSEAPLGGPTYGDHEDNADDGCGDQEQEDSTGARLSTAEEILIRPRIRPKSRCNGGPVKSVPPENIDPAIRDQSLPKITSSEQHASSSRLSLASTSLNGGLVIGLSYDSMAFRQCKSLGYEPQSC